MVWLADLGLAAKTRPVLVMNIPFGELDYALFQVVPHTTTVRGSQFEVAISVPCLLPGVFNIQGSLSVPRAWLLRRLGRLSPEQMRQVEHGVRHWLGLV